MDLQFNQRMVHCATIRPLCAISKPAWVLEPNSVWTTHTDCAAAADLAIPAAHRVSAISATVSSVSAVYSTCAATRMSSDTQNRQRWYRSFLPRTESPLVFLCVFLCYQVALARLMTDIVVVLHMWPTVADPSTHIRRSVSLGVEGVSLFEFLIMPIAESLVLVGLIQMCAWLKFSTTTQIIAPALVFSALHSVQYIIWGVLVIPGFVLDAGIFVYWRARSFLLATCLAIAFHLLVNGVPIFHSIAAHVRR